MMVGNLHGLIDVFTSLGLSLTTILALKIPLLQTLLEMKLTKYIYIIYIFFFSNTYPFLSAFG